MDLVTFVVLHYMTLTDTEECVSSILELKNYSAVVKVVVVDNGSKNDSYKWLCEKYDKNEDVIILKNENNEGFARGNNRGFIFAKETLNANYIVLLNNDTVITDKEFIKKIIEKYNSTQYAILGPDIVTLDGRHQNPSPEIVWTNQKLIWGMIKRMISIAFYACFLGGVLERYYSQKARSFSSEVISKDIFDVKLHGACWIFSYDYISRFDGLDARTFMYMEEDVLRLYAKHYNLLMLYSGELSILHKEDVATNESHSNFRKRRLWHEIQVLKSMRVYQKIKRELR